MDGPADTMNYMIAGFVVIFGMMLAYMLSLVVRFRNFKQDEAALQELAKKK